LGVVKRNFIYSNILCCLQEISFVFTVSARYTNWKAKIKHPLVQKAKDKGEV
jgi:hypothetical protein